MKYGKKERGHYKGEKSQTKSQQSLALTICPIDLPEGRESPYHILD